VSRRSIGAGAPRGAERTDPTTAGAERTTEREL
jgi:hypothetical protein